MFSGNGESFCPFVDQACEMACEMNNLGQEHDLTAVSGALERLYKSMRGKLFVDQHISRIGCKTIE